VKTRLKDRIFRKVKIVSLQTHFKIIQKMSLLPDNFLDLPIDTRNRVALDIVARDFPCMCQKKCVRTALTLTCENFSLDKDGPKIKEMQMSGALKKYRGYKLVPTHPHVLNVRKDGLVLSVLSFRLDEPDEEGDSSEAETSASEDESF
jgi:hypothetical protein